MSYLLDIQDGLNHSDRLTYSVVDIEPFRDSLNKLCRINNDIYKVREIHPAKRVDYGERTSYLRCPCLVLERVV